MPLPGQIVDWLQQRVGVDAITGVINPGIPNPPNQLVTGCVARSRAKCRQLYLGYHSKCSHSVRLEPASSQPAFRRCLAV